MPYIYNRKWSETIVSGHSLKVYSERIDPGYILLCRHVSFYTAQKEANDNLQIILDDSSQTHVLKSRASGPLKTSLEITANIYLGELDRLCGYAPDADNNDVISLSIHGVLMFVEDFTKLSSF